MNFLKLFLIGGLFLSIVDLFAQEYSFTITSNGYSEVELSHNLKGTLTQRGTNAQGTVINVRYDNPSNWNSSQKRAIEYAAHLWEEQLFEAYPTIKIRVRKANIGNAIAQTTTKDYSKTTQNWYERRVSAVAVKTMQINNPSFLTSYFNENFNNVFINNDDITITLSNNDDRYYWGTDGNTPSDKYDVVTIILREIAKGCELKNTIFNNNGSFEPFYGDDATLFDYFIPNNASGNINIGSFTFYGPTTFQQGISYFYLTDESAQTNECGFLRANLPKGYSWHKIGNNLTNLLRNQFYLSKQIAVGEPTNYSSTNTSAIPYLGTEIMLTNQTTIEYNLSSVENLTPKANNYDSYIEVYNGDISSNWYGTKLELLKTDGTYVKIAERLSNSIEVNPSMVEYRDDWARNADGYLRARLRYRHEPGHGSEYVHYIYLDYLPLTPDLDVSTLYSQYDDMRMIIPEPRITFNTIGATSLELRHECEYGTYIRNIDPNMEYLDLDYVDPFVENTFIVTAINDNGEKQSETICWGGDEFIEYLENAYNLEVSAKNNILSLSITNKKLDHSSIIPRLISHYKIVNLNTSQTIDDGKSNENFVTFNTYNYQPGIYGIQVLDNKGKIYNSKFIKK